MQEFMQIALNRFKFILFLSVLYTSSVLAQQVADISLKISVEPSTVMYPGQQGVMTFEITNNSALVLQRIWGGSSPSAQGNRQGYTLLTFDNFHVGRCGTGSPSMQPPITVPPLWAFHLDDLLPGETEVCQVRFAAPENIISNFTTFNFQLSAAGMKSNMTSVRINIKKRIRSVPVLNIWGGFALLLALMVAARQHYKKSVQCKNF